MQQNNDQTISIRWVVFITSLMMFFLISAPAFASTVEEKATAETQDRYGFSDDAGRQIKLEKPAKRIVAGASFAVELLMAIDCPPVLRPEVPPHKIYPESAAAIPALPVQHSSGPDVELIAASAPDLVILHVNFASFADNISQVLGVPVALMEVKSVDDVLTKLELLGRITDQQDQAKQQVEALQAKLDEIKPIDEADAPRVLALFGTPGVFYAYRDTSYIGSMLDKLGATNLGAGRDALQGMQSIAPIDLEQIIKDSPNVILVIPHGPPDAVLQFLAAHPAWSSLDAVKNNRVHILDEVLYSSNPGPRAPLALVELKQLLVTDRE